MPTKKMAKKVAKKTATKTVKAASKKAPVKEAVKEAVKKTVKTTKRTAKAPKKTVINPEESVQEESIMTPIELPPAEPGEPKDKKPKEKARAIFAAEQVICEPSDAARDLYAQSRFGATLEDGKIQMSLIEALYLLEKEKLTVADLRGRLYDFSSFIKKAKRIEPNFWVRYGVFKDMRNRGYIVQTALKFGAD